MSYPKFEIVRQTIVPGIRYAKRMPASEVCMHLQIVNKIMGFELINAKRWPSVQLYGVDGNDEDQQLGYSFPIGTSEAGLYERNHEFVSEIINPWNRTREMIANTVNAFEVRCRGLQSANANNRTYAKRIMRAAKMQHGIELTTCMEDDIADDIQTGGRIAAIQQNVCIWIVDRIHKDEKTRQESSRSLVGKQVKVWAVCSQSHGMWFADVVAAPVLPCLDFSQYSARGSTTTQAMGNLKATMSFAMGLDICIVEQQPLEEIHG